MFSNHAKSSKSNKTDHQTPDLKMGSMSRTEWFRLSPTQKQKIVRPSGNLLHSYRKLPIEFVDLPNLKMVDRSIVFREGLPEGHFSQWKPTFAWSFVSKTPRNSQPPKKTSFHTIKSHHSLALRPSFFPFPCGGSLKWWSPKLRGEYSSGLILDDLGVPPF